MPDKCI